MWLLTQVTQARNLNTGILAQSSEFQVFVTDANFGTIQTVALLSWGLLVRILLKYK